MVSQASTLKPPDAGIRVLLIEDNPGDARLVRETLKAAGFPKFVVVVEDRLSKALEQLGKGGFDIALVDLSLPDSSGIETFRRVRERARSIPVLVLSGLEDAAVAGQAVREGAQDYVYKSKLVGDQLGRAILYALSRQQLLQQLEEQVEHLRASEERYRVVTEAAQDAILTVDDSDQIAFANSALERLFGYSRGELIGKPATTLLAPEARTVLEATLSKIAIAPAERSAPEVVSLVGRTKQGKHLDLELTVGVSGKDGRRHFTVVLRDVSRRNAAEQTLRLTQERSQKVIEHSEDAFVLVDVQRRVTYASPGITKILGYAPEEVMGKAGVLLIHPDDQPQARERFKQILAKPGVPIPLHYRIRRKDGSWRYVEGTTTNLLEEPSVRAIVSNLRDATERVEAEGREAVLRKRAESLARISKVLAEAKLDSAKVLEGAAKEISEALGGACVIRLVDEKAQVLRPSVVHHPNPEATVLMGSILLEAPVPLREGAPSIPGWGERPVLMDKVDVQKLLAASPAAYRPYLDRFPPASLAWLPMKVHGRLLGLINVGTDPSRPPLSDADMPFLEEIADRSALAVATSMLHEGLQHELAERRKAEEAVRRSEELFSKVFRASPVAITISTLEEGTFLEVNDAAVRLLGYSREELVGHTSLSLGVYDRPEDRKLIVEAVRSGAKVYGFGSRLRTKTGDAREVEVSVEVVNLRGQRALVILINDLTERRSFERMREEILDVVSHEFRTPVTVIQGYADLLASARWQPGDENFVRARRRIETSSRQLGFLLTSLTELASLRAGQTPVTIDDMDTLGLLQETIQILEWREPRKPSECQVVVEEGAEVTRGDRRKLVIALSHIVHNAAKFSPEGRPIRLSAKTRGANRLLVIEDEGPGISESILERMGKPFVQYDSSSTRATQGAGLGLTLAVGLVEIQGGSIEFSKREGGGTVATTVLNVPPPKSRRSS